MMSEKILGFISKSNQKFSLAEIFTKFGLM